jgi:hypothetical protein
VKEIASQHHASASSNYERDEDLHACHMRRRIHASHMRRRILAGASSINEIEWINVNNSSE